VVSIVEEPRRGKNDFCQCQIPCGARVWEWYGCTTDAEGRSGKKIRKEWTVEKVSTRAPKALQNAV